MQIIHEEFFCTSNIFLSAVADIISKLCFVYNTAPRRALLPTKMKYGYRSRIHAFRGAILEKPYAAVSLHSTVDRGETDQRPPAEITFFLSHAKNGWK